MRDIEQLAIAATKGPWHWAINLKSREVVLESRGRGAMLEIVMDFVRWGMGNAKPRFLDQEKCLMVDADKLTEVVPRREHHAAWHQDIRHPDADFIAASREAIPKLVDEIRRLRSELASERATHQELWQMVDRELDRIYCDARGIEHGK